MAKFKYAKKHGTAKAGDVREMHQTTAKALAAHKVGEVIEDTKKVEPKKEGKAGPITTK